MSNFLYNFLNDKINDNPETEVIENLPIYKTPYKNSPEFEKRPYWFLHNKLKKKLYDCLPTLQHPSRPPPTWTELMNTPFPPGSSGDASLADSFRMLDEKVQIKKLRLWILGCLSAKNQTWQDFLNDRIYAASNLGVSSNGTGLGDILYNFEKKCERDYNNLGYDETVGALELARRQRGRRAEMGQLADQIRQRERAEQDLRDELERLERPASAATPGGNELFNRAEFEELDRQHAEEMAREEDELVARGLRVATEEEMDTQRRLDFQNGFQGGRRRTKKKRKRRKKKRKKTRKKKRKKRRKKKRKKTRKKKLSENLTR
jgi:hypothetical protein